VSHVERGLALAVDYGHVAGERPLLGSLTAYRAGREVEPVADGSCDLTVAVALDAVAAAGAPLHPVQLLRQAEVLRALGADGGRPPIALASEDPAGYVRALARAGAAAELTDPAGLGGHHWILHWV
jgi:SAM-dependent MidA family methyltransferase